MNPTAHVTRGASELRRLLEEQTSDIRSLDVDGVRTWLARHEARWQSDPVFIQRLRIRELRKAHPDMVALERQHRQAVAEDAASPQFARLEWLEQALMDTQKAISGLTGAAGSAPPERQIALQEKLRTFLAQEKSLDEEHRQLIAASQPRRLRYHVEAELQRLRMAIGLDREEATLATLLKEQGRRTGKAGESFEDLALLVTQQAILPDLLSDGSGSTDRPPRVLTGVTLGAPRVEFDQLIVREASRAGLPVEVLAVVEVKRNINDMARGFRLRQENLAWLTGDSAYYDPAPYRTRHFLTGHFDRESVHEYQGQRFIFDRTSFRRFHRDPSTGLMLDCLYFIARPGFIWGLSMAAIARVRFRVATDELWDPEDEVYLKRFLRWCRSLTESMETPDVLETYMSSQGNEGQILLAQR
jgi:hypothetical protein